MTAHNLENRVEKPPSISRRPERLTAIAASAALSATTEISIYDENGVLVGVRLGEDVLPKGSNVGTTKETKEVITHMPVLDGEVIKGGNQPRIIINRVPTVEEFNLGSNFQGENGEYADVSALMKNIELRGLALADPEKRKKFILQMDVPGAKRLITTIHKALYPEARDKEKFFATKTMVLAGGKGSEYSVGTIGIDPRDFDEAMSVALEAVQLFVRKDDLKSAGILAGNALVLMQLLEDGNKRTARALSYLIGKGYDGSISAQVAMRTRLGFTREAKYTMYYDGLDGANRRGFCVEGMNSDQSKAYCKLSNNWQEYTKRDTVEAALSNISDEFKKRQIANIIQQDGFGALHVIETVSTEALTKMTDIWTQNKKAIQQMVTDYLAGINDSNVDKLIEEDRRLRLAYFKRIVQSTTDEKPLYIPRSDGTLGDTKYVASLV